MANGDKAAAAGLTVFNVNQLVRNVYDFLNIRGDELAGVLTRTTKLETNAKTRETVFSATAPGASGRGQGLKAVTSVVAVPRAAYARTAEISFRALVTDQTDAADLHLRKNSSSSLMQVRSDGKAQNSVTGTYFDTIAANTAVTYSLGAQSSTDEGTWNVTGTEAYTGLQIKVTEIS